VLANVTRHFPGALAEAITNAILAQLLGGNPDDFPTLQPAPLPKSSGLPGKLEGQWVGTVHTHQGKRDVTIWFERNGDVNAQLGPQPTCAVRDARLDAAAFMGTMDGDMGTDDARRRQYELQWDLALREDSLNGTLYATAKPSSLRPLRLGYCVELHRVAKTR
jgi:hypothetical protein